MSNPPPTRVPPKLDPETERLWRELLRSVYLLWNALGKPPGFTAAETDITHTAPGTPDYAIQDLTDSGPFGFVTKDEGNTVLQVIANLQTEVAEIKDKFG